MSLPAASGLDVSLPQENKLDIDPNERPNIKLGRGGLGFTLIELLVVAAIIVMLIGAGAVSWTNSQRKSRDGKRKADLKTIQQALENYHQAIGHYPPWTPNPGPIANTENLGWCTYISSAAPLMEAGSEDVKTALSSGYLQKLPADPVWGGGQNDYWYEKVGPGQYRLLTILENDKDPELVTSTSTPPLPSPPSGPYGCGGRTTTGGYTYNYYVTQP